MVNFEFGRRTKKYVPFDGLTVTCQGVNELCISGECSGIQVTGMIEWGQNSIPKKSLGLPAKPKKIPGPKFNPKKITRVDSLYHSFFFGD